MTRGSAADIIDAANAAARVFADSWFILLALCGQKQLGSNPTLSAKHPPTILAFPPTWMNAM